MTDRLDRVAGAGLDLLGRVDTVLAVGGAPAGDPVWPLLRQAGGLPGDLLAQLVDAAPQPIAGAGEQLRADARALDRSAAGIPDVAGWSGYAAEGFAGRWSAATAQLDRITERMVATGDFAAEVAAWVAATRRQVAGAVAECLASPEAATVRLAGAGVPDAHTCAAAAAIAAHVLATAVDAAQAGQALRQRWAGRLDEVRYVAPAVLPGAGAGAPSTIEL